MSSKLILKFFIYISLLTASVAIFADTANNNAKESFIETNNAAIFCRTIGSGHPIIVIHGGPGLSQDYLLPQMDKLAENNLVIFYDQRGCGKSTGEITQETITVDTFVNDIDAIRKSLGYDKVSLLGHSWGGFLAMQYAISHPEHVAKLILSNSMPASSDEVAHFVKQWISITAPYREEIDNLKNSQAFKEGDPNTAEKYNRIVFRTYCFYPENANHLNLQQTPTGIVNGAKVSGFLRKTIFQEPFNFHSSLNKLNIPTLIIHGDGDPIPVNTAESLHKSISNSKYIVMKNCGHFPYVEDPDTYFNHLNNFFHNE